MAHGQAHLMCERAPVKGTPKVAALIRAIQHHLSSHRKHEDQPTDALPEPCLAEHGGWPSLHHRRRSHMDGGSGRSTGDVPQLEVSGVQMQVQRVCTAAPGFRHDVKRMPEPPSAFQKTAGLDGDTPLHAAGFAPQMRDQGTGFCCQAPSEVRHAMIPTLKWPSSTRESKRRRGPSGTAGFRALHLSGQVSVTGGAHVQGYKEGADR